MAVFNCNLVIPVVLLLVASGQGNLLTNGDFEEDLTNTWEQNSCQMSRHTNDFRTGSHSVLLDFRNSEHAGLTQLNIPIVKGRHYGFEGYVRLLNDVSGNIWQTIKVLINVNITHTLEAKSYPLVYRTFGKADLGWIKLVGDIEAPNVDFTEPKIQIRGPAAGVNMLVDNLTLVELPEDPLWRDTVETNIEQHRKADVTLSVNLPSGVPASEVTVEVSHQKHRFGFGSLLRSDQIVQEPTNKLMRIAYSFFDWGTIGQYKWKQLKGDILNNPNMSEALVSTNKLRSKGMKVVAHNILWNVEKNIPTDVKALPASNLPSALSQHVNYVMTQARNLVERWDLMNEHTSKHYYEERTQNPNITKDMFRLAHSMNDRGALFLNEFQCVTSGAFTQQVMDIVNEYLAEGVPIQGFSCQGHVKEYVKPDPTAMMRRAAHLGTIGLPMVMSEFDSGWTDPIERGDWMEDAVRAFFGSPALSGLVLWDFSNATMRYPDKELVTGNGEDQTILESGQRWWCLVRKEWTTQKTFSLTDPASPLQFRGFQGEYDVRVRRNGVLVQRKDFILEDQPATWTLDVTTNTAAVPLEEREDFVGKCVSHRNTTTLATSTSSSTASTLSCVTVKGTFSASAEDAVSTASCASGQVMTGCFGLHRDKEWTRKGERIEVINGVVTCVAYNGANSPRGVKAMARCCSKTGLTCSYKKAGPAFPFDGAMAEVLCDAGDLALGCSSYARYPDMDGVKPNGDLSGCRAQSGAPYFTSDPTKKSGVEVYAACCSAPSPLQCNVQESDESGLQATDGQAKGCPGGDTATGCHVFAEDGKPGGATILNSGYCKGFLGDTLPQGSTGVRAYTTCCTT